MTKPPSNIPEPYIAIPLLVNATDRLLQLFQLQIQAVEKRLNTPIFDMKFVQFLNILADL